METETAQLIIYYTQKAKHMKSFFPQNGGCGDDDLKFLLSQLKRTQELIIPFKQPWSRYIPMLHKQFALNPQEIESSVKIISLMTNIMHHGRMLDLLIKMNSLEIKQLERIIAER